ncbi:C-terminal associated domain of TOPRIM [Arabidopsis thaliana x Arabidopsis arenosa]|uniref:DNA topoisomerase 2 n=1 Tax=Arabidopsis thaliana x Arabidopsis arenosa TaxID=1240361 RepID=A0A8T2B335_9BRAS|nr:C-terminal associated domain of TOPRIM [Arabidopsis thaliana x Arabidopsis arenosa]
MATKLPLQNSNNANVAKPPKSSRTAAAGKTIEEMYQKKSQLEHILLRPDTYIGSIEKHTQTLWVYEKDEMVNRSVTYVPGLYKIFDEILVNAADNKQRDPSMDSVQVVIDVEQNLISVCNSGAGVPVEIHQEEGIYVPEMIFGHLLTSSNYDDNVKKTTGGRNGYGAKLTNIFSTEFIIETADGKRLKKYKQVFENNMGKKSEPVITKCNKSENWTKVTFKPDLKKFNMTELEDDVVALMSKRVFDIAGCLGKSVKVELNGKQIPVKSFTDYVDLYLSAANKSRADADPLPRLTEKVNDRWEVCVSLSEGQFQQVSFVNSIATIKGGTHVDYVTSQITNYIVGVVNKKNKNANVKAHNVKNHLWVFVNALIDNPAFDSQTKETLTLRQSSFGSKCELSEDILKKVGKCGVVENLLSWADFKQSKDLKKSDGAKTGRVVVDKLDDAAEAGGKNSRHCTLILTEGDSAKSLALAGRSVLGNDYCGVFPLRGKLLNVREASTTQITNNKEIENLKKILGLKQHMKYENVNSLRYGHMMIMTDQDHDGSHIKGLLINFIHSFWPSLLKVPSFLVEFITPIVKATHKNTKKVLSFYSMPEYEDWKESLKGNASGWEIKYYKGLGTSTSEEGKEYFSNLGLHKKDFVWEDEQDGEAIELAFSKKKIEARKNWLSNYVPGTHLDQRQPKVTYSDFVNKELILFSMADLQRSIPSMVDGLKPGQRKILFVAFKKIVRKEMKVAQLCGYVSSMSAYHHGEQSLASAIIGMAQDYMGSNNINLLQPNGQFGTRTSGGKDAASARYIFTKLSPVTRILFPKDDDVLLNYLTEDGQSIEPTWYMPIIPTVLVNGSEGIGTGWSTFIPNYNPREIVANVRRRLNGESMLPMDPWYRGFKGTIEKTASKEGGCTYTITGLYEEVDDTTIRVTELPIRRWNDDYKQFLQSLKTDNGAPFFQDIKAYNDDKSVDFDLILSEENMLAARQEGFLKKLKLTTTIATSNMHLFDKKGVIKKYATPEQILEEFFDLRFEYYEKRKETMVKNMEIELLKLENKVRFILGVLSGEIIVNNRKKADIVEDLRQRGFTPFPKKAESVEAAIAGAVDDAAEEPEEILVDPESSSTSYIPGSEYDYLLAMAIGSLTIEKVEELLADRDKTIKAVEDMKKTTPKALWLGDLESLDKELDKLDLKDAKAEEDRKAAQEKIRKKSGAAVKVKRQAPKKPAPKKTTKKASESETTEASYSAMDTDNNVAEVVKPKGRQAAKKKAPAAAKEVEEDDMLDLAQRLAQYNFGSAPVESSKTTETSKAIAVDDDDDDVVVEVAPVKKGGRKPAASKAAKPPAAPRKRGKQTVTSTEVVAIGVSPEKKVRKMRSSPFNKKSSSVMSRLANKEEESSENVAGNSSSEKSGDVAAKSRPQRANRRKMTYVLSDSESESANDSEFDDIEDDEDDE